MAKKIPQPTPPPFIYQASFCKTAEFVLMPSIVHMKLEKIKEYGIDPYATIDDEDYQSLLLAIQNALMPYKEDISKYYFNEFINLANLLSAKENIFDFSTIYEFLDHCRTLPDLEVKTAILYSVMADDGLAGFQESLWLEAEDALRDPAQIMSVLNDIEHGAELKWMTMTLLQDPKGAIENYKTLLKSIEPIFESFYAPYEERLPIDVEALFTRLETLGENPLNQLSHGILNDSILPNTPIHFLYSYFYAYSIMILPSFTTPHMIWGNRMAHMFDKLKELHAEQQMERVTLFKTLGDKTRYDVLKCIANGTTSTKAIADVLGVTSATISYHLSTLTTSKLILLTQQDNKLIQKVNKEWILHHIEAFKKELGIESDTPE